MTKLTMAAMLNTRTALKLAIAGLPLFGALLLALGAAHSALAQQAPGNAASEDRQKGGWGAGLSIEDPATSPRFPGNTTVIQRSTPPGSAGTDAGAQSDMAHLKLVAMLTADGQSIDKGVVWRIYEDPNDEQSSPRLLDTHRNPSPSMELKPGKYIVNASFGRANLTRNLELKAGDAATERFVINAGGLRIQAIVSNKEAAPNTVFYDIYEGESNQLGERGLVLSSAKPGVIVRLNAGIYHIVSTYGDTNAQIAADVTVEAGKLTEAALTHAAAKVTLGLVTRPGGEAQPATQWTIATPDGDVVKRSVGALPTHILKPGTYKVTANHSGRVFEQEFKVEDGQMARIEVLIQ